MTYCQQMNRDVGFFFLKIQLFQCRCSKCKVLFTFFDAFLPLLFMGYFSGKCV